jgi:hypothetical protein
LNALSKKQIDGQITSMTQTTDLSKEKPVQLLYSSIRLIVVAYLLRRKLVQLLCSSIRLIVFLFYLYLPYRIWQLYEGMMLIKTDEFGWIQSLLVAEIILWTANYALDLSQLPRLLRWDIKA